MLSNEQCLSLLQAYKESGQESDLQALLVELPEDILQLLQDSETIPSHLRRVSSGLQEPFEQVPLLDASFTQESPKKRVRELERNLKVAEDTITNLEGQLEEFQSQNAALLSSLASLKNSQKSLQASLEYVRVFRLKRAR